MDRLTTERLVLRPWELSDADFAFAMYSRWDVQRFIGRVPRIMSDRAEAVERIAGWRAIDRPHAVWAVEHRDTGNLVGTLLLKSIPASGDSAPPQPSGDTEIGWHFHPDHWGMGYASEAAAAALSYAFECGVPKVVAVTSPDNRPSQKVCERIGMSHVGLSNRYYNAACELYVSTRV